MKTLVILVIVESFKDLNIYDSCDLEYGSRSFLVSDFIVHPLDILYMKYEDPRPYRTSGEKFSSLLLKTGPLTFDPYRKPEVAIFCNNM